MAFEKKVPIWEALGIEPPESLKTSGFDAGYKPPADYFNWFWHTVSEALTELQDDAVHNTRKVNGKALSEDISLGVADVGAADTLLGNLTAPTTATKNLIYRGNILASNAKSADTYTSIGVYKVYLDGASGAKYNFPTPYGIFVVNASMDETSYDYVSQMFYAMGNSRIYSRSSSDKGATWTAWQQAASNADLTSHTSNKSNPHGVTCSQLGAVQAATSLAKGIDLDTVVTSGFYRINENPVNAPADVAYSQLLVVRGGGDTIAQVIFPYNQARMFFRTGNPTYTSGTGTWKEWVQVYTTFNKPTPADIGAATSGHTHALTASTITGTLPVNKGGTGATTAADARKALDALCKSGDTMTGPLKTRYNYPSIQFYDADGKSYGQLNCSRDTNGNNLIRLGANAKDTEYAEFYAVPLPSSGLTSHKYYQLLTTKAPVPIANGGTGAANDSAALTALGIRRGKTSSISAAASAVSTLNVTFSSACSAVPIVTLTVAGEHTNTDFGRVQYEVTGITKTGFTIRVINKSDSNYTVSFNYIAVIP